MLAWSLIISWSGITLSGDDKLVVRIIDSLLFNARRSLSDVELLSSTFPFSDCQLGKQLENIK